MKRLLWREKGVARWCGVWTKRVWACQQHSEKKRRATLSVGSTSKQQVGDFGETRVELLKHSRVLHTCCSSNTEEASISPAPHPLLPLYRPSPLAIIGWPWQSLKRKPHRVRV